MTPRQVSTRAPRAGSADAVADRLHSAAIHLLRRLRREDDASGLSAPRLSALSVLVFAGPQTIGALAAAEQVRVPTMSRLVAQLEADGLLDRSSHETDRRVVLVEATPAAHALLHAGRRRRVAALSADVARMTPDERRAILEAIPLLERLAGR
ncbi:MAG: MarR family transcriptional regulator [Gemmatimonadaceae bacterium]